MRPARVIGCLSAVLALYGAEHLLGRSPDAMNWHHEGLTRGAASKWSREARNALAFHTTYVDAYQYNPVWWLDVLHGGGINRIRTVLSSRKRLSTLHFDDVYGADQISCTWKRYLSGAVCGLMWAASSNLSQREKISCAHNLIGVSLHAIQDFYAHSNWIDSGPRRDRTWFEAGAATRALGNLYTGYYEKPGRPGAKPHGALQPRCTWTKASAATWAVLHAIGSPAWLHRPDPAPAGGQERTTCAPARIPIAGKLSVPKWLGCASPGMNLDSRWQAVAGVEERGEDLRPPLSAHAAFEAAFELAQRSSLQWITMLQNVACEVGHDQFWQAITSLGVGDEEYKSDTQAFERADLLPYLFLSAGPYPPLEADDQKWYLHFLVETGDLRGAGAWGDIIPCVNGQRFEEFNHDVSASNKLLALTLRRAGFGRGQRSAHVVGPLDSLPHEVSLINAGAPPAGDRHRAVARSRASIQQWHCQSVEVVAFRRGHEAEVVHFSHHFKSQWVEPGGAAMFSLRETGRLRARVPTCWAADIEPK